MASLSRYSVLVLTTAAAILGGPSAAKANLLASAIRTVAINGNSAVVTVPLTDSGSLGLAFSTSADRQKVVIRYNAECGAFGSGWLSVSILVDGVQANPASGTDFAMCTNTAYVGALRQSTFTVPTAGAHSVTVTAQSVSSSAPSWRLDDTSLTVEK